MIYNKGTAYPAHSSTQIPFRLTPIGEPAQVTSTLMDGRRPGRPPSIKVEVKVRISQKN
jgi:hypothetical protein